MQILDCLECRALESQRFKDSPERKIFVGGGMPLQLVAFQMQSARTCA